MIKICEECGKEFNAQKSTVKRCSRECYYKSRIKGKYITCPCGNKIWKTPARTKKKYCSDECFRKYRSYEVLDEVRQKISDTLKGNIPWNKGKKATRQSKINQSLGHTKENEFTGFRGATNNRIRYSIKGREWQKRVFEKDNYTCFITNIKSKNNSRVTAHHIRNFSSDIEKRFDVNNGVTLLRSVHKEFHKKYGKYNNNMKQLREFREVYKNGTR